MINSTPKPVIPIRTIVIKDRKYKIAVLINAGVMIKIRNVSKNSNRIPPVNIRIAILTLGISRFRLTRYAVKK